MNAIASDTAMFVTVEHPGSESETLSHVTTSSIIKMAAILAYELFRRTQRNFSLAFCRYTACFPDWPRDQNFSLGLSLVTLALLTYS